MEAAGEWKEDFLFLVLLVTLGLLLLEHPQLRGRRRQPLVTRIPAGSEPSSGCQVSTGQWLINRTFPFLNPKRMGSINGHGGLTSWVLAHEAVSWVHLPSSFPSTPSRPGLIGDRRWIFPLSEFLFRSPPPLLWALLLSPFPSLLCRFLELPLLYSEPWAGKMV